MATLTITDAARVTGVSRMLLYRYIKSGKLSRTPEGLIDTTELLRAGLMLQTSDVTIGVAPLHDVTPVSVTPETSVTAAVTAAVTTETHTLERLIDVLQRELDAARERETLLLQMLSQMQQQNQRLLDMPRSAPTPTPRTERPPAVTYPAAPGADPRGAMRRRIAALLQAHPEGLTPTEIRTRLGMLRDGLVQRVGRGRYVSG